MPHGNRTVEENFYFNTDETFGGEYCDLRHNNFPLAQARHQSTSGRDERSSNTQNSHGEDSEQTKRHKKVTLQDPVRSNTQNVPLTPRNRGRTRLVSDSQLITKSSRHPEERNCAQMANAHPRNASSYSGSVRTQPSNTSEESRIPEVRPSYSYLNRGVSEDLTGNSPNKVITDQPKLRGLALRQDEEDKNFTGGKIPRHLGPKPRTVLNNESQGLENGNDFTRNRMFEANPREGNTHVDSQYSNMNRTRTEARTNSGTECERERKVRVNDMHKQSSTERNYDAQRERTDNRGEKRSQLSSGVRPHGYLGNMNCDKKEIRGRENKTIIHEDIEMTNLAKAYNPRVHHLRKNPLLGLAFPRPHTFDVPENKPTVSRTFSSPEMRRTSLEEFLDEKNESEASESTKDFPLKNDGVHRNRCYQPPNNSSKAVVKIIGKRSKSIPLAGNTRTGSSLGRRGQPAEASPLRYFAYLGKRFQFRERLLSTHNVLSARPVILTSTSVISPEVTTNFCQQLEDSDPCDDTVKHQGACQDLIDCCTCMCCVKALFYHCTKDDESEGHSAEHPCSCNGPDGGCFCRWSVLGMLSLVMPCILCYLPLQGCAWGVEYCRRKPSAPDDNE